MLVTLDDCKNISVKELSSIIGLNEEIAGALKRLSLSGKNYPIQMLNLIEDSAVSFRWIRKWISKPFDEIEKETQRLLEGNPVTIVKPKTKVRGRSGGAVKRSATFKVIKEHESIALQNYLLKFIPDLQVIDLEDSAFHNLEKLLYGLLALAKA